MGKTQKTKATKTRVVSSLSDIPEPDAASIEQENTVEEPEQSTEEVAAEVVEEQVPPQFKHATPGGRRMTREEAEAFMQRCGLGVFIPAEQLAPQLPPNFPQAQMFVQPTQPQFDQQIPIQPLPPTWGFLPQVPVQPTPQPPANILALFNQLYNQGNTTMDHKKHSTPRSLLPDDFFDPPKKKMTKKEEDAFFKDEFFWNPGPEWDTIGLVAGGVAAVGLGALLYHLLKK